VTRLAREAQGWMLWSTRDGDDPVAEVFDAVLVATPAPQALALIDGHSPLAEAVRDAAMTPCWAVMCAFEAPLDIGADALFVNLHDTPLAWAARDSSKPGRPGGERWVLHATATWSAAHLEDDAGSVTRTLVEALAASVSRPLPAPIHTDVHRWRYARGALDPMPGALVDASHGLAITGDWCHGARIEGAWLSGVVAAERLLASP
jgi:renalase